jgi:hypothetical protein
MMLDLDREWGREPGWAMSLPQDEQELLIGLRRHRAAMAQQSHRKGPPSRGR